MTKLLLDEDTHSGLVPALRRRGIDAIHVRDLNRDGLSDEEQLKEAIRLNRAILTFNQKDFDRLHKQSIAEGIHHFGIIMGPQMTLSETLKRTVSLLRTYKDLRDNLW